MAVYLLATLDTKGPEAEFIREQLRAHGVDTRLVDTGSLGAPTVAADVPRDAVFSVAGADLREVVARNDRGEAVTLAAAGAAKIAADAWRGGQLSGVLSIGGSAGTTIGTAAMRSLPVGVPKVMVSTLASGQVRPYVGDKDIAMFNAVVDIAGINRLSRLVLGNAAAAMAGMVRFAAPVASNAAASDAQHDLDKPLIAATMFGVTTPCVQRARQVLEQHGFEVLVFHATGNGGQAMESLINDGLIAGVLDITTTELADELVGGILSAGPDRLTAAARRGIPQVVSVGALDMVNFGPPATVPEKFQSRKFHRHNPTVTLMRTTAEENARLGDEIGRKVAAAQGPASILLPLQGVSAIDRTGQPFDDPDARDALFSAIRSYRDRVDIRELNLHINDTEFADAAAHRLLELMQVARATTARAANAVGATD